MKPVMVAFDVAGTTVMDDGIVLKAFEGAFSRTQPHLWDEKADELMSYATETMGQSKIEVFTHLVGDSALARITNLAFEDVYLEEIKTNGAEPVPGAEECFNFLRSLSIPVVLTTGFSRQTLDTLMDVLGWKSKITLSVTPDEAGRGRPFPDMLEQASNQLKLIDRENSIVLGDTVSDMQAGLAYGARSVIGVLTGAHTREMLIDANATSVINSVVDLPSLI